MNPTNRIKAIVIIAAALLWLGQPGISGILVYDGNTGEDGLIVTGVFNPNSLVYHASIESPIVEGKNLYAPDFIREGNVWYMYYGGWRDPGDPNDRIYFAESDDLVPEGPWYGQYVIIDNGSYIHANDPSVQKRGPGDWVMAYTVAEWVGKDHRDWIAISTSTDGVEFYEIGTPVSTNDPGFERDWVTSPGLLFDNVEGRLKGVAYGMTDDPNLTEHDIGFSYPQLKVEVMTLPDVWHVYTQSRHFKEAVQMTFGYDTFHRIVVRNPVTGAVVADKWVSSVAGDRWKLLFHVEDAGE